MGVRGVGAPEVVGRRSVFGAEIDATEAVAEDAVAQDGVAAAGGRVGAETWIAADEDADAGVVSDAIARAGDDAADGVVGSLVVDEHAVEGICDRARAVGGQADVIALHDIGCCLWACEHNAGFIVAGDDVACRRDEAADDVVGGGPGGDTGKSRDRHARIAVAEIGCSQGVDADVVSLHLVEACAGSSTTDDHAAGAVAGDDVACPGHDSADRVIEGTGRDFDAIEGVGQAGITVKVVPI